MIGRRNAAALALLGLVAGCASTGSGSGSGPGSAANASSSRSPLVAERAWLEKWFAGVPVEIGLRQDGQLTVEVPLEFSFAVGRANVQPPLAKVLDKVVEIALRHPGTRLHVAAPADAKGAQALAQRRAAAVRSYLADRGVAAQRFAALAVADAAAVQLRVEPAAAP